MSGSLSTWLKTFGCYPPEYNRAIHGPYNPAVYYGKKDPLSQVKLSELPAWIKRRNYNPRAMAGVFSRFLFRHSQKYLMPYRAKATWVWQTMAMLALFGYVTQYKTIRHHYNVKYH